MNDEGCIPDTSHKGLTSTVFGELKESLRFPLQDAARREWAEKESLLLVPLLEILSTLAFLCMVTEGVRGDWNVLLAEEVRGVILLDEVSCNTFVGVWTCCSTEGTGVGTKNAGLAPLAGLVEAADGDWNTFVGFPPPWLKVSTYLQKTINEIRQIKCQFEKTGKCKKHPGRSYFSYRWPHRTPTIVSSINQGNCIIGPWPFVRISSWVVQSIWAETVQIFVNLSLCPHYKMHNLKFLDASQVAKQNLVS